jgi:hypothetical protein
VSPQESIVEIPGLGPVEWDEEERVYRSECVAVQVLRGELCQIILEGYEEDEAKEDFHIAIKNFLAGDFSVLQAAEPYIFQYYKVYESNRREWDDFPTIESPPDIWHHIRLGDEPVVTRRPYGDKGVYVSLEGNCDWEPEHGIQIVLKNGLTVNKVGEYDGWLTYSDALGSADLEDAIFVIVTGNEWRSFTLSEPPAFPGSK